MLSDSDFKSVIKNTNLFAFDFIIEYKEQVVVGKRNNPPAKDFLFVPGGRVHKNESLHNAFERILKIETGLILTDFKTIQPIGLYEHIYKDNFFLDDSFNTHYIVYAFKLELHNPKPLVKDEQNESMFFMPMNEFLGSEKVHEFSKNYYLTNPSNKLTI